MYPSPNDLGSAPLWENYVVAQAVQASLGLISDRALALGVRVHGTLVRIIIQLSAATSSGEDDDIEDIRTTLEDLVGPDVTVEMATEVVDHRRVSPHDGVRWVYLKRLGD